MHTPACYQTWLTGLPALLQPYSVYYCLLPDLANIFTRLTSALQCKLLSATRSGLMGLPTLLQGILLSCTECGLPEIPALQQLYSVYACLPCSWNSRERSVRRLYKPQLKRKTIIITFLKRQLPNWASSNKILEFCCFGYFSSSWGFKTFIYLIWAFMLFCTVLVILALLVGLL
jgi:hypothetical protein